MGHYAGEMDGSPGPNHKIKRLHQVDDGACAYCDREKAAANTFHPPHDASENCQSGKRKHCSCDTCF